MPDVEVCFCLEGRIKETERERDHPHVFHVLDGHWGWRWAGLVQDSSWHLRGVPVLQAAALGAVPQYQPLSKHLCQLCDPL